VPVTESGGRIHTSTYRRCFAERKASMSRSIPMTLRLTPTAHRRGRTARQRRTPRSGSRTNERIVVTCQDQSSQYKNKDRAWRS
jgi:protein subunit release factor A